MVCRSNLHAMDGPGLNGDWPRTKNVVVHGAGEFRERSRLVRLVPRRTGHRDMYDTNTKGVIYGIECWHEIE